MGIYRGRGEGGAEWRWGKGGESRNNYNSINNFKKESQTSGRPIPNA